MAFIKVEQLIEKLSKFPKNADVVFWNESSDHKELSLTGIEDRYFEELGQEERKCDEVYINLKQKYPLS